jgi:hypothetical protein
MTAPATIASMSEQVSLGMSLRNYSLRARLRHCENLVGLLIKEQMVITEVRAAHVPMEILGLHVEREHIGENGIHRSAYVLDPARERSVRVASGASRLWLSSDISLEFGLFMASLHLIWRSIHYCPRADSRTSGAVCHVSFVLHF